MWRFQNKWPLKAANSQIVHRQSSRNKHWWHLQVFLGFLNHYWALNHDVNVILCCKLWKIWTWYIKYEFIQLYKSSFGLLSSRHNYAQRWLNHIFSFARPFSSMYCCFVTFSPQWISQVPTLFMTSLPHFFLSCYTIWQMDANCRKW